MLIVLTGYCSKCHKIWTLEKRQGLCRWCGKPSTCQTTQAKPRHIKSRSNGRKRQTQVNGNGYDQLEGDWLLYYKVASRYEGKIPAQDRDDFRHDVMLELERAEKRDGKPLPELRAYRIASLMVALYYRNRNRFATRVCIFSGYPVEPHCRACKNKTDSKRCAWLGIRPVERLDGQVIDPEGYRVRLLDTVASDRAEDMPDRWYDLKKLSEALPLRLAEIAYKRLEGIPLDGKDREYLSQFRKKEQKRLF